MLQFVCHQHTFYRSMVSHGPSPEPETKALAWVLLLPTPGSVGSWQRGLQLLLLHLQPHLSPLLLLLLPLDQLERGSCCAWLFLLLPELQHQSDAQCTCTISQQGVRGAGGWECQLVVAEDAEETHEALHCPCWWSPTKYVEGSEGCRVCSCKRRMSVSDDCIHLTTAIQCTWGSGCSHRCKSDVHT